MKNKTRYTKGFTLMELLVVILIIGILAAVALPQYQRAVEKSRLSEAISNMRTIQNNVKMYILEHGEISDYHYHDNWDVDLSGGSWDEDGFIYTTNHFVYAVDDNAGVAVWRCNGTCTKNFGADEENAIYEIYQDYAHTAQYYATPQNPNVCWGRTDVGRYICKSLEAQGYEDRSGEE